MPRTVGEIFDLTGAAESVIPAILAAVGYAVDRETGAIRYHGVRIEDVAERAAAFPEEAAAVLDAIGWRVDPATGRAKWAPPRGEAHPSAKLAESAVREIRASRASVSLLAALYGVRPKTIRKVRSRDSWRHVI